MTKKYEQVKKWRANNPEKMAEYQQRYKEYQKNWCKNNRDYKRYYAEHTERCKAYSRAHYKKYRKEILSNVERKEYIKMWNIVNSDRVRELGRIKTRNRQVKLCSSEGAGINLLQWKYICEEYAYLCVYCGKKKKLEIEHIIPISKGGIHDISNIVPACRSCNASKSNKSLLKFLQDRL